MAVLSCLLVAGLLVLAGANLVYPLVIAAAAVLVGAITRTQRRGNPKAADEASKAADASSPAVAGSAAPLSDE
jgi:hypothetical protein